MSEYREYTYLGLQEAKDYLDSLQISNTDNAIWWCLHQVVWHKGVDRVRWILENKDLVKEISEFPNLYLIGDLQDRFWESVEILKNIDR